MAGYIPAQPDIYQGKQIVINSDRILFNAKNDAVLTYADKAIGFSTEGSINFDNKGVFVINSKENIYLGLTPLQKRSEIVDLITFFITRSGFLKFM